MTFELATRERPAASAAEAGLRYLWIGLSAASAFLVFYAVARRFSYPYPVEWLESATVDMAERVRNGLPIYTAPTYAYVAPMKTPLYYYLVAAVSPLTGGGFMAGRLVSILAMLGTLAVIWRFVRDEGASRLWAVFGIALYVATFRLSQQWYDIARLDSAFLFFAMTGLYGMRFWTGRLGTVLTGLVLAAAFFTKQTILMVAAPVWVGLAVEAPRRAALSFLSFASAVAGGMALLHLTSDGWSTYFLVEVPQHGGVRWQLSRVAMPLLMLAPALLLSGAFAFERFRKRQNAALFYGGLFGGTLICSIAGRLHDMGSFNAFMPLYGALAVMTPLALQRLEREAFTIIRLKPADLAAFAQALLLCANMTLATGPMIPSRDDRAAADRFVAFLENIDGDVLAMNDRYYTLAAGKSVRGLDSAATDLLLDREGAPSAALRASILDALRSGCFVGVLDPPQFIRDAIRLDAPVKILDSGRRRFRPNPQFYYRVLN